MKHSPTNHLGFEFVRISELPIHQAGELLQWIPRNLIQSIKIDSQEWKDCVPYADYDFWFDFHFEYQQNKAEDLEFEI
ncbi:hypothetical protein [Persicobacter sp. CCB-QB2]|uniref:hypothetical protein n=1 Tax=Persicobacter sp. CCB-QB2 TaxID=1561025 RepID=UPI0006A9E07E|nr:hypothetical protein [Persicobacter sp. CCB-QB2]